MYAYIGLAPKFVCTYIFLADSQDILILEVKISKSLTIEDQNVKPASLSLSLFLLVCASKNENAEKNNANKVKIAELATRVLGRSTSSLSLSLFLSHEL